MLTKHIPWERWLKEHISLKKGIIQTVVRLHAYRPFITKILYLDRKRGQKYAMIKGTSKILCSAQGFEWPDILLSMAPKLVGETVVSRKPKQCLQTDWSMDQHVQWGALSQTTHCVFMFCANYQHFLNYSSSLNEAFSNFTVLNLYTFYRWGADRYGSCPR